jgi:hypothetical protein
VHAVRVGALGHRHIMVSRTRHVVGDGGLSEAVGRVGSCSASIMSPGRCSGG